jgi:hypothetical protein
VGYEFTNLRTYESRIYESTNLKGFEYAG